MALFYFFIILLIVRGPLILGWETSNVLLILIGLLPDLRQLLVTSEEVI
jgi:hypothetical protein